MAMTETERVRKRLSRLIVAAHNENYDFVYIPVGTAKTIVRLVEELEKRRKADEKDMDLDAEGNTEEAGNGDEPAGPDRDGDL